MQHNIICNSYGRTVTLNIDDERIGTFTTEDKNERTNLKLEVAKIITKIEKCKSQKSYDTHIRKLKSLFQKRKDEKKQDVAAKKSVERKNKKSTKTISKNAKTKASKVKALILEISNLSDEDLDKLSESIPQLKKKQESVPKTKAKVGKRRSGEH